MPSDVSVIIDVEEEQTALVKIILLKYGRDILIGKNCVVFGGKYGIRHGVRMEISLWVNWIWSVSSFSVLVSNIREWHPL